MNTYLLKLARNINFPIIIAIKNNICLSENISMSKNETNLERLFTYAKKGDSSALAELIKYVWSNIWSLCFRLTQKEADCEDVFQEAIYRIYRWGIFHKDKQ